jgi:hypothetical protein
VSEASRRDLTAWCALPEERVIANCTGATVGELSVAATTELLAKPREGRYNTHMRISEPRIHLEGDCVKYAVEVRSSRGRDTLWYTVPESHAVLVSDSWGNRCQVSSERPSGVATGLSAGLDFYCALADHHYSESECSPLSRITHMLFNDIGPSGSVGDSMFVSRYERLLLIAARMSPLPPSPSPFGPEALGGAGRFMCVGADAKLTP